MTRLEALFRTAFTILECHEDVSDTRPLNIHTYIYIYTHTSIYIYSHSEHRKPASPCCSATI